MASIVNTIYQDRRGYLWFGTPFGLSRFDGYRFTNYFPRDGLVLPEVTTLAEGRDGTLGWARTEPARPASWMAHSIR